MSAEIDAVCGNCGKSMLEVLDKISKGWENIDRERFPVMVFCHDCEMSTEFIIEKETYRIVGSKTGYPYRGFIYKEKPKLCPNCHCVLEQEPLNNDPSV